MLSLTLDFTFDPLTDKVIELIELPTVTAFALIATTVS